MKRIMKSNEMSFWMTLYGNDINLRKIEEFLQVKLDNNRIRVPDDLPDSPDGPIHYDEIAWLLRALCPERSRW